MEELIVLNSHWRFKIIGMNMRLSSSNGPNQGVCVIYCNLMHLCLDNGSSVAQKPTDLWIFVISMGHYCLWFMWIMGMVNIFGMFLTNLDFWLSYNAQIVIVSSASNSVFYLHFIVHKLTYWGNLSNSVKTMFLLVIQKTNQFFLMSLTPNWFYTVYFLTSA